MRSHLRTWIALTGLFILLVTFSTSFSAAQRSTPPLSERDVLKLLRGDVSATRVAELARQRGIDFQLTPTTKRELREAGATDELLQNLRKCSPKSTAPRESPIVQRSLLEPASLNERAPEVFRARFATTRGDFMVEVTRAWAPLGADRFYNLVKNGFYNNCVLFRVVPGFVVQFGISGDPKISGPWSHANIPDDPVTQNNRQGTVSFATAGPDTRTTQVFINLTDNSRLDGQGFAPFGQVVQGMEVIARFDSEYNDQPTSVQDQIQAQGNAFLESKFPNLDRVNRATIVPATASLVASRRRANTEGSSDSFEDAGASVLGQGDLLLQVTTSEGLNRRGYGWQNTDAAQAAGQSTPTLWAQDNFDVVTGNTQGTVRTLNGKAHKPLGREDEFKEVHLSRGNLSTPVH